MTPERRQFLADSARLACGAGMVGLALSLHARRASALPPQAVRPPGAAVDDADFQSACVRCGLCVRDCPYDILALAPPGHPVATGTPFFVARTKPCEMCEDLPCVKACPTGALDPALTEVTASRMGLAVLIDQRNCLNHLGLRCDICYRVCPVIDEAITLQEQRNPRTGRHTLFLPTVNAEHCTGCGKCEHACPLPVAAIKVLPVVLARGEASTHYRLGWEEQRAAGAPLAAPEPEHQYHLPEGLRYAPGRGLEGEAAASGPALPSAPPAPAPSPAPRALQGDRL